MLKIYFGPHFGLELPRYWISSSAISAVTVAGIRFVEVEGGFTFELLSFATKGGIRFVSVC
jgi:hypothetical protein